MKKTRIYRSDLVSLVFETPTDSSNWFGYYNYDTLNHDQTKMLACRPNKDACLVEKGMSVELGYYDLISGDWCKIGVSDSFNWPQGAMLQWIPGKGNENKVIYNLSKDNHLISRIHDISTGEDKDINWSIYCITPDGLKSIALNLERSYWCRAYHYESVVNETYNVNVSQDDGIFEIDLVNNKIKQIISIIDVINIDKKEYFDQAKHWLEHIMINESGTKFCFLHRFAIDDVFNYETRLIIADIDGRNMQLIDGWKDFRWSHFGWNGDDSFVIYAYQSSTEIKTNSSITKHDNPFSTRKKSLSGYLKSFLHMVPKSYRKKIRYKLTKPTSFYQYYTLKNGKFKLDSILSNQDTRIDGHPSFTKDHSFMITDSYPDPDSYQRLIVYNIKTNKSIIIAKIFAALHMKPGSCDLHPKLSKNNDYLAVDTAFDGKHHMILFKLNWDLIQKLLS